MDERQTQLIKNKKVISNQDYFSILSSSQNQQHDDFAFNAYFRGENSFEVGLPNFNKLQDNDKLNVDYLQGYDLNEKQYSELVLLLDKQQENKEKDQRRVDLNKINYFSHLRNSSNPALKESELFYFSGDLQQIVSPKDASTNEGRSYYVKKQNRINSKTMRSLGSNQYQKRLQQSNSKIVNLGRSDVEQSFRQKSNSENKPNQTINQTQDRCQKPQNYHILNKQEANKNYQSSQNTTLNSTNKPGSSSSKQQSQSNYFYSTFQTNSSSQFNQQKKNQLNQSKSQSNYLNDTSGSQSDSKSKMNNFIFKGGNLITDDEESEKIFQPLSSQRKESQKSQFSSKSSNSLHLDYIIDSQKPTKKQQLQQPNQDHLFFPTVKDKSIKKQSDTKNQNQDQTQSKLFRKENVSQVNLAQAGQKNSSFDNKFLSFHSFDQKNMLKKVQNLDLSKVNLNISQTAFLTDRITQNKKQNETQFDMSNKKENQQKQNDLQNSTIQPVQFTNQIVENSKEVEKFNSPNSKVQNENQGTQQNSILISNYQNNENLKINVITPKNSIIESKFQNRVNKDGQQPQKINTIKSQSTNQKASPQSQQIIQKSYSQSQQIIQKSNSASQQNFQKNRKLYQQIIQKNSPQSNTQQKQSEKQNSTQSTFQIQYNNDQKQSSFSSLHQKYVQDIEEKTIEEEQSKNKSNNHLSGDQSSATSLTGREIKFNTSTPQNLSKENQNENNTQENLAQGTKQRRSQQVKLSQISQLQEFIKKENDKKQKKKTQLLIQNSIQEDTDIKKRNTSLECIDNEMDENSERQEEDSDTFEDQSRKFKSQTKNTKQSNFTSIANTPSMKNFAQYLQPQQLKDIYGCEHDPCLEDFEIQGLQHYCDFKKEKLDKLTLKKSRSSNPHGISMTPVDVTHTEKEFREIRKNSASIDNFKKFEEPKRKQTLNEPIYDKHEFGDGLLRKSILLQKHKETLERKFQQYLKQCFMGVQNPQIIKKTQSLLRKKSKRITNNPYSNITSPYQINAFKKKLGSLDQKQNEVGSNKQLSTQNNIQQNSKDSTNNPASPLGGYVKYTVNINPPISQQGTKGQDEPALSSPYKKKQTYQFITYKNGRRFSIDTESDSSRISDTSSENIENSSQSSSQSSIDDYIMYQDSDHEENGLAQINEKEEGSQGENLISRMLGDKKYSEQENYLNQNGISQQISQLNDYKSAFIIVRNYLVKHFQAQASERYQRKIQKCHKLVKMIELKQQRVHLLREEDLKKNEDLIIQRKSKNLSPKKLLVKVSEKQQIKPQDIMYHTFSIDFCNTMPLIHSEKNSLAQDLFQRQSLNQAVVQDTFLNFSTLNEINGCQNSKEFNQSKQEQGDSQSSSRLLSDSSYSSESEDSDQESMGTTQHQLGIDIVQQEEEFLSENQIQFINDLDIYEDENFNPFSLQNEYLKLLAPQSLCESSSLFENLSENIPPIISELHNNFIESVLTEKRNKIDPNIKQILQEKNSISEKYKKITDMVTQEDQKSFKTSYINYCKEEEEILIGQWEDKIEFNSEISEQFQEKIEKRKSLIKSMKMKLEPVITRNPASIVAVLKKKYKYKKRRRGTGETNELKDETEETVQHVDSLKSLAQDSEIGSENLILRKKSLDKKISPLPQSQSPKESQSEKQEITAQITRSKFQKFSTIVQKRQNDKYLEDLNKTKRSSHIYNSPLQFSKEQPLKQYPLLELPQDLTPLASISPLIAPIQQTENNISQQQITSNNPNSKSTINNIKSPLLTNQSNTNLLGTNIQPLNLSSSIASSPLNTSAHRFHILHGMSNKVDGMDKKSLSMRSRILSINKRKQMSPEDQLFGAIKDNQQSEFEDIFQKYNQIKINSVNNEGDTFLITASRVGNMDMVKDLLFKGININHQNNEGNTALHMALAYGNSEVADLLLTCKIDQTLVNKNNLIAWDLVVNNK